MRLATCKAYAACLLTLSVAALSACGGTGGSAADASDSGGAKVVDIYSSLPMGGPAAAQAISLENGINLALEQAGAKAGPFTVQYTPLDDATGSSGWDASKTAANARQAAADPRAVYYIGEFDNEASAVSMPILNEAGIPQVSPANTYVGLTTNDPGSASGEPKRYWPTGTRTYLRIVPNDAIQAAADLEAMKDAGCAKVALADDEEPYGAGLAKLVEVQKRYYGVDVMSDTGLDPSASSYRSYAEMAKAARPDCFLLAGIASKPAVQITEAVHAALPAAKIFAPDQMCTSAWTNPRDGGVPASIDPLIECTAVTRSVTAYPGGKAFLAAYRAKYSDSNPSPYAILGYEAMKLGLSTIAGLGVNGDSKSAVLSALFATTDRRSVLGTYGFDRDGDTTLRSYGLYKVGPSGEPTFVRTITPTHVL
jgi:branched-chain amino acid transport system substrate-binding protein